MQKHYSEFQIISVVAIEHTAALFYSWSIRYIVNIAPGTCTIRVHPPHEKYTVCSTLYRT